MLLATYLKRRDAMRIKYSWVRGTVNIPYSKAVAKCSKRIKVLRRAIRKIEQREIFIKQSAKLIFDFMGEKVLKSCPLKNRKLQLARDIFCRYCIEAGLQGPIVSQAVGSTRRYYATVRRKRFIQSFKTNLYNRDMWYRFKSYYQLEKQAA